jgi:hypothetical protein
MMDCAGHLKKSITPKDTKYRKGLAVRGFPLCTFVPLWFKFSGGVTALPRRPE